MDIPTWFKFKDVDSRDYGIVVINYPPVSIIDFTKAVRGNETRMFSVIFTVDPFLYEVEPESNLLYGPFTYANDSQLASYPHPR